MVFCFAWFSCPFWALPWPKKNFPELLSGCLSKEDDKYAKPVVGGQVKAEGVKVEGRLNVSEMEAVPPSK